MFLGHLFLALLVAISLSAIMLPYRGRGAHWSDLIVFFVVVWLGTWALGAWITPVGPVVWGAPLVVFAFLGIVLALLAGALGQARHPRPGPAGGAHAQVREGEAAVTAFSIFFWVLTAMLMLAIVARYSL